MPEFRVYIPESKSGVMYQFKEQFGKEGSPMIVTFMEESLTGNVADPKNQGAETARIFDLYFGDITNEREFSVFLAEEKARKPPSSTGAQNSAENIRTSQMMS